MAIDFDKIALDYAKSIGYDTIRPAGEKNGNHYFHCYWKATLGHKLGLPCIIHISEKGHITRIHEFEEIMWAKHQISRLNNL